ncbi:oligosaccharide flippase family protein [Tenacibaculum finnmarkense genomovar ulcerans]|uniref:oligosaccharide flippase family protein n=1 Tax=Tenacibaculum finnmarkense TaxID=2781243 RepID=UPI00187B2C09|nr:oligosaccharide flippase family protein [Tenacibaculum finnmarkense]MBE7688659.1 oligosaccharide flippase family protein [Tenacibaculum finnmarkense genomovar ulcerans]
MSNISTSSNQVKRNLYTNIIFLCCNILVGIYYTPYLVAKLGVVAYGVLPLALVINQYITVFTSSITAALSRFLSISIQREEYDEGSKYMSSSLLAISVLILILAPFIYLFISNLSSFFNIPDNLLIPAKGLFTYTIVSFFISLLCSIFNISQYSYNRLDLINTTRILRTFLRMALIIIFFEFIEVKIIFVGYVSLIVETIVLILSFIFFKIETRGLIKISFSFLSKNSLYAIIGMTGWVMLHVFGDTFLYQMDVVFLNKFWGTKISGIFGAFTSFGAYVLQIVSVVSSLFGPLILVAYSKNNHIDVQKLAIHTSVVVGGLTSAIVGVLIVFSQRFIANWLSYEFAEYWLWMAIKISWVPFYASAGIYSYVYRAHNKVMIPAIFTIIIGLVNLVSVYLIYSFSNGDLKFVLLGLSCTSVLSLLQSYLFGVYWFNKIYPGNIKKIFGNSIVILVSLACSIFIGYIFSFIQVKGLWATLILMGLGSFLSGIIVYFLIFRSEQREIFKKIFIKK